MNYSKWTFLLSTAIMGIFVSGCSTTRIHSFTIDASEAPEVYGISRFQEPHSGTVRLYGSFKIDPRETVYACGSYGTWTAFRLDTLAVQDYEKHEVNGQYRLGGNEFTGGFEWFYKSNNALIGVGFSINDGLYHHITYGFNFEHFEIGSFLGLFHQYTFTTYSGKTDKKKVNESKNDLMTSLFGGGYIGAFVGDGFLNYTISAYRPDLDTDASNVKASVITTHYFTLGYHINKYFAASVGAVGSNVTSQWHWGVSLGFIYSPF